MQIPILSGNFTDGSADVRTSYPVNCVPVALENGVSTGYLRPGDGLVEKGTGPGVTRGGINWLGVCYRVMGSKLVSVAVDGAVTVIGDVGEAGQEGPVSFDYGPPVVGTYPFGLLAIACDGKLFYFDGTTLTEVTDPNVGIVKDVVWVDGFFMVTDGDLIRVSSILDPFVFPAGARIGADADPDPIVALVKLRNEVYALNRHTIEVFDNVGGAGEIPFARVEGAQVQKGCIGTRACCVFLDLLAFLGGGRNEAPGIYLAANAATKKVSTTEIDRVLAGFSEAQLADVVLEARNDDAHDHLYVHLPDRALVFDATASQQLGQSVWFTLTSTLLPTLFRPYRARHFVWAYDRWLVGDPTSAKVGETSKTTSAHFGDPVRWEFGTTILYNKGAGVVFPQLELVALPGRVPVGADPRITTSFSSDGMSWSQERSISAGAAGQRTKRLVWFGQGELRNMRMQRFRGTSDAHLSFLRLEAAAQPLAW